MSERNVEYQFVEVNVSDIVSRLTTVYQQTVGRTVHPSSPEKLFLSWVASAIVQIYQNINYAANQNLPSRATGENLDALAQLFYMTKRPDPVAATVPVEFTISEAQTTSIVIPQGTQVTNEDGDPIFETVEEAIIAIGDTTVTVQCVCQTPGTIGNGFEVGQLNECVDMFPYFESCTNTETSAGGIDSPDDDEFYDLLVNSEGAWSCAGPRGAYKYFAKSVSLNVADVVVNSPDPGDVNIYVLMDDGTIASSAIKAAIAAKCNDNEVRPLTDLVSVEDPATVSYDITVTYYMSNSSQKSATEITADVNAAVDEYKKWQSGKLGRDINPSKLTQMMVEAGAKRVVITSPTYTQLRDGNDPNNPVPQVATIGTVTVTNGGYENE